MKKTILVADDDRNTAEAMREGLEDEGYAVLCAGSGTEGLELARAKKPDLVITDLMMPGMDGLVFLKTLRKLDPFLPVVIITGQGSVETAVEALKEGAVDYLAKPVRLKEVVKLVARALEVQALRLENLTLKNRIRSLSQPAEVVGRSPAFAKVLEIVRQVAPTRSTVLVTGESGTGKELVANLLHQLSPRSEKPLIKVNCAAIPETLLEAELFGHEKGAFTGAVAQKKGRFELAHEGTLFLDEVGDMSLALQAKLLRCLQEGEFERVGGTETLRVDVRLVAATNQDLAEAIAAKRFREDLYYRLNVIAILVPPLRERVDDIPLLIGHFIRTYAEENEKKIEGITQDCLEAMTAYPWPGNVRELENIVEQLVVMAREPLLRKEDLPAKVLQEGRRRDVLTLPVGTTLEQIEQAAIRETMALTGGNKEQAAALLGIHVATLYRKLSAEESSQKAKEKQD
ncbi:MAG TPA: sigma-54 dependent transcriptional regulator [Candidatus Methanoperedens sp.]|nr:sigma-54 dependent transcriptional regulator [Candidatus Methanoperedens sp.]